MQQFLVGALLNMEIERKDKMLLKSKRNWPMSMDKFRSGNLHVEYAPHSGGPVEVDKGAIKALVDAKRWITTRDFGLRLNLSI